MTHAALLARPTKYDSCACGSPKRVIAMRCRACRARNDTRPIEERFWKKVKKSDGCWSWTANTNGHYGILFVEKVAGAPRWVYAHRFSYEQAFGTIPSGLTIDHLCRNTLCVNPSHLEAVTQGENNQRSWDARRANHDRESWS